MTNPLAYMTDTPEWGRVRGGPLRRAGLSDGGGERTLAAAPGRPRRPWR